MSIVVPPWRQDDLYRTELLTIIQNKIDQHERNYQFLLGPSEIGSCERQVTFKMAYGASNSGPGGWAAHKGTVRHAWLAETFSDEELKMPDGSPRFLVELALESQAPDIMTGGTGDMYDRLKHAVVDWKLPGDFTMDKVRSGEPSLKYYVQANVYGYHLSKMGHPVATVNLAFLPMAGDDLHGDRRGALICTWDYDESVALEAIASVRRKRTLLDLADNPNKIIMAMPATADFCHSCPAFIGSSDRRGTCPGADVRIPAPKGNPFA